MAEPSDKQMLRDANGDLIPQYWDIVEGNFKALTGQDGAQDTRLTVVVCLVVYILSLSYYSDRGGKP